MAKSGGIPSQKGFLPRNAKALPYEAPGHPAGLGSQVRLGGNGPAGGSDRLAALAGNNRILNAPTAQPAAAPPPPPPPPAPPPAQAPPAMGAPHDGNAPLIVAVDGEAPDGRKVTGEIEFPPGTRILGMRQVT